MITERVLDGHFPNKYTHNKPHYQLSRIDLVIFPTTTNNTFRDVTIRILCCD